MILLCGIPSETPLAMVHEALREIGEEPLLFNQREFAGARLEFRLSGGQVTGSLGMMGQSYRLEDIQAVYLRLMDDRFLPELESEAQGSPARTACRALHDALVRWCEIAPARVVNRAGPMGSNFSKPYQAQLIRAYGFHVPETLITNDPELVLEFRRRHGRVIYKSISGVRSIVKTLEEKDLQRLDHIRWCPTQFQEFVEGSDVRVHTIGTRTFATAVAAEATDYRYAHRDGREAELQPVELSDEAAEGCVRMAEGLGLGVAGIDLRITPDGDVYCFEINPSPAFSYYEANTGQPIARAIARYLAGTG